MKTKFTLVALTAAVSSARNYSAPRRPSFLHHSHGQQSHAPMRSSSYHRPSAPALPYAPNARPTVYGQPSAPAMGHYQNFRPTVYGPPNMSITSRHGAPAPPQGMYGGSHQMFGGNHPSPPSGMYGKGTFGGQMFARSGYHMNRWSKPSSKRQNVNRWSGFSGKRGSGSYGGNSLNINTSRAPNKNRSDQHQSTNYSSQNQNSNQHQSNNYAPQIPHQ